ncbi:hypothetical protein ACFPRL_21435 [Pseudoclavibacter helvolus]
MLPRSLRSAPPGATCAWCSAAPVTVHFQCDFGACGRREAANRRNRTRIGQRP